MRIRFFLGSLKTGGAERQFAQIAEGLARSGHDVKLLTLYPGGSIWERLERRAPEILSSLYPRRRASTAARFIDWARAPLRLRRELTTTEPTILYSALYLADVTAWIATRGVEGAVLVWGIRASDERLNLKRWIPFKLSALVSNGVALAIANSEAGVAYHAEEGFRPRRWKMIPNGIDVEHFKFDPEARRIVRESWGIGEHETLVGHVGRPSPVKGHALFLTAACQVARREPKTRFVCVGAQRADLPASVGRKADAPALADKLLWLGERTDMSRVYSALDVLVSSSYGEGFPNVVAEAMACGCECVVTDVGDAAVLVGESGYVVRPGCSERLAESLLTCLREVAESRYESPVGALHRSESPQRQRIVQEFSLEVCLKRTESALADILDRAL